MCLFLSLSLAPHWRKEGVVFVFSPTGARHNQMLAGGEKPLLTTANKNKKCPSSSDRMGTHLTHPSPLQPLLHHPPPAPPPPHPGAPLRMWFGATVAPELKSEPEEGNEAPTDTLTFSAPHFWVPSLELWRMTQRVIKGGGGVEEEEEAKEEESWGSGCSWV